MTPSARNRWTLIAGGALCLLLIGAWLFWFLQSFERAERTVRSDLSGEAHRNPYLAAERYLERVGRTAETVRGRDHLKAPPALSGALVVPDPGPDLPPAGENRLLDWVDEGGHLVLTPRRIRHETTGARGNGLLDRLGVRLRRRPLDPDAGGEYSRAEQPYTITVRSSDGPGRVAFDPAFYLEDTAGTSDWSVAGDHGFHALAWRRGAGRVTVLSDDGFMRNDRIGELDHAWFVSHLLRGDNRVWLLIDSSIPPLTEWLWRHAPQAVVAACLLAIAWLWRASLTHGPRHRPRHRVRRNIIEHLAAAASFAWQRDGGRGLLDGSRAGIEAAWIRRHPALHGMDRDARCEWVAQYTGLPVGEVAAALYEAPADEQALIRVSNLQQRLMKRRGDAPRSPAHYR